MYETFFGLKRKPFPANPKGAEVFVGPQTARILKSIKNALAGQDAIVAVAGPAGIGKTALLARALDAYSANMEVIRIPRARLRHDEILDFLLERLAADKLPAGTLRRVLLCRELFARKAQAGRGICILVEDAERLGIDALVEIEALTAGDGTEDKGARVILQGGNELGTLLQQAELTRLAQRTRLRFQVQPLGPGELLAYLKHGLRLAGGDYDRIFPGDAAMMLHELSGGVPRKVNHLLDAVMAAASDEKRLTIDSGFIAGIAREQFGLEYKQAAARHVPKPVAPAPALEKSGVATAESQRPAVSPPAAPKPSAPKSGILKTAAPKQATAKPAVLKPEAPKLEVKKPEVKKPEAPKKAAPAPAMTPVEPPMAGTNARDLSPTGENFLIHDTLPDLEKLAPGLARAAVGKDADAEDAYAGDSAEIPTLFSSTRMESPAGAAAPDAPAEPSHTPKPVAAVAVDVPAWDKDPTLAELRPDLEALELAMAEFSNQEPPKLTTDSADDPDIELKDPTIAGLPEITLDVAIQQKIAEATEALRKHDQTITEEEIEDAPGASGEQGAVTRGATDAPDENDELRKVAEGIANAKSLEDVDDRMAETLFGEEFSAIARAVAANAPSANEPDADDASIELQLEVDSDDEEAAGESVESAMEREFREVYGADAIEVSLQSDTRRGGLDLSASQRLATVRALNAEKKLSESARIRTGAAKAKGRDTARAVPSQTIEEQFETSMTQTLKALSVRPANDDNDRADDDDDDDDDRKGGFFSRFRRH